MSAAVLAAIAGALAVWCVVPAAAAGRARRTLGPRSVVVVLSGVVLTGAWVWPPTLAAALAAAGLLWLWRGSRARAARRRTGAAVIEVCDVLAGELAAGRPSSDALVEAAAAWTGWQGVVDAADLGADVPAAIRAAARSPGADGLRLLAAGWEVSHRTGRGLTATVLRVAADLRAESATQRVIDSELASARSTARLVAVLPALAWLMAMGAGGDPLGFLLGTPVGLGCLLVGVLLQLVGLGWIEGLAGRS